MFSFLLTFFHQLILRKNIFGAAASLIPYFLNGFMTKSISATATISTNVFLDLVMTSNCANTISKHGQRL